MMNFSLVCSIFAVNRIITLLQNNKLSYSTAFKFMSFRVQIFTVYSYQMKS
jgi:hypothetical protein